VWNPETDSIIDANYGPRDLAGKQQCKAELQKTFGLPVDPAVPLVGMVSRMAAQKGFDLLETVADELVERGLQFVLVGSGDEHFQTLFETVAARHPGKLALRIAFDDRLAHQVEAGADMFLMPSRYEPCGLNQLYSLRYGTIPIVRATGGLKDSVQEFDGAAGTGTGFLFEEYEGSALLAAVDRALAVFRRKREWTKLVRNAMAADYSWNHSAGEYLRLYRELVTAGRPVHTDPAEALQPYGA